MPRYIDADNIHPVLVSIYYAATSRIAQKTIEKCDCELSKIPTADVAPIVHGHWCLEEETFSCSNCNAIFFCGFNTKRENQIRLRECYKFCPVCGAQMESIFEHEKGEENNVQTENR